MERLGGSAAPTAAEPKWSPQSEATVIERQVAPPKRNTALIAGIAAVIVVAVVAIWFATRPGAPVATPANTVVSTAGTEVTTTSPKPISGDQGVLLLSASPWGELDRIVSKASQQEVPLADDVRATPARIALEPGQYSVTVNGPQGSKTVDVEIRAGQPTRTNVPMGGVDFNELEKELTRKP
jgi:hypothetical protein